MDDETNAVPEHIVAILSQPWIVPSTDETVTPDVRDSRALETLRAITFDKPFGAKLHRRLEGQGLGQAAPRNDATVALDDLESLPGWKVRWVFADQGDRLVVRSLLIEALDLITPPGGLTANTLRSLSPAAACATAGELREVRESERRSQALFLHEARSQAPEGEPRRRGRPGLSDHFLAQVALAYLGEMPKGRGVLRRVGAIVSPPEYKGQAIPDETVRDWVHKARTRGYLGPAPKAGARGGAPGPKLLELLNDEPMETGGRVGPLTEEL